VGSLPQEAAGIERGETGDGAMTFTRPELKLVSLGLKAAIDHWEGVVRYQNSQPQSRDRTLSLTIASGLLTDLRPLWERVEKELN
jgi:hypothetical protein